MTITDEHRENLLRLAGDLRDVSEGVYPASVFAGCRSSRDRIIARQRYADLVAAEAARAVLDALGARPAEEPEICSGSFRALAADDCCELCGEPHR